MKRNFISLLCYLWTIAGFSQNVEIISTENSKLPEDNIWSIEVDSTGTVWLGTANSGLISFSNGEFAIYNDSTKNLKGEYISPIFYDSKDRLWFSTSKPNELWVIEEESFRLIEDKKLESIGSVIAIEENQIGEIYFGGTTGLVKYTDSEWIEIELPLPSITIRALAINEYGELAIGHNKGLIIGYEGGFQIFEEDENQLQLSVVRGLKYAEPDKLLVGYGGGFGKGGFSIKEGDEWTHFNRENARIVNHMVRDIEIDDDGIFWMATNEGLTYLKNGKVDTIFFREGRMKNTIMDIATYRNEIWIATNFGIIHIEK